MQRQRGQGTELQLGQGKVEGRWLSSRAFVNGRVWGILPHSLGGRNHHKAPGWRKLKQSVSGDTLQQLLHLGMPVLGTAALYNMRYILFPFVYLLLFFKITNLACGVLDLDSFMLLHITIILKIS